MKIAAARVGFNKPYDSISPDLPDKNLDLEAVTEKVMKHIEKCSIAKNNKTTAAHIQQ
jgi:hypothetical protein